MLKKKLFILLGVLVASVFTSCALAQTGEKVELSKAYPLHFAGKLPGANCELKYELHLLEDKSYLLKTECQKNDEVSANTENGKWHIDDENRLLLEANEPRYFSIINESTLELMNLKGEKIDSALNYKLELHKAELQNTYWKLVELNSKVISASTKREAHIVLDKELRIKGHSGCNSFNGTYELKGEMLKISGSMMMTRMFCRGSNEGEFIKALHSMQSYIILGEYLEVLDSNGSEIARFESVYLY